MVSPSALAALAFTTRSNRVGWRNGSSLGFAPLSDAGVSGGVSSGVAPVLATRQQSSSYEIALEKQLRWGIVLAPELGLTQVGALGASAQAARRTSATAVTEVDDRRMDMDLSVGA